MNKDDLKRRDEAIDAFMQEFGLDFRPAADVIDKLLVFGRRAQRNAENLCNVEGAVDRRDNIRKAVAKVLKDSNLDFLKFKVGGDPRGYCLKIIMPSGRHNTWGGAEEGWGF